MSVHIGVNCSSRQVRDQMFQFLKQYFKDWKDLYLDPNDPKGQYTATCLDEGYPFKSPQIFDFILYAGGSFTGEWDYIRAICGWIALKIGKTKKFAGIDGSFPSYFWQEKTEPVIRRDQLGLIKNRKLFEKQALMPVTKYGLRTHFWNKYPADDPRRMEQLKQKKIITREMIRLDRLWQKWLKHSH